METIETLPAGTSMNSTGKVHYAKPGSVRNTLACTGRTVGYAVGTSNPVTCAACLKRFGSAA